MVLSKMYDTQDTSILITGGAGFVGSHVAMALLERGDQVVIVDDLNDYYDVRLKQSNLDMMKSMYPNVAFVRGDIADMDLMKSVFQNYKPRRIVHLAARAGVRPSIENPFLYIRTNIVGTTNLLELARKYGNDIFVWASSSSVYGNNPKEESCEDDLVDRPMSQYAATKKACELIAHTYSSLYNMNITGLRFFTVYGPRGRLDMVPSKFIDRITRGLEIQQYGDGSSSRDYTYIDDIVDGVVRALDIPMGYQIINLGNGTPHSLAEFISIVEKHVGKKAIIRQMPDQPGDVRRTCASISKARTLLGYNPSTTIETGLQKTVAWYKLWIQEHSYIPCIHETIIKNPPLDIDSIVVSHWLRVQKQWDEHNFQSTNQQHNYEYDVPTTWTLYKKKFFQPQLRYCMSDLLVGFYNPTDAPLVITIGNRHKIQIKIAVHPKSIQPTIGNYYPLCLGHCMYQDFEILSSDHDDFFLIYMWFPSDVRSFLYKNNYTIHNDDIQLVYKNGGLHPSDNDKFPEFPFKLTDHISSII